jgi:hypothetical protein
MNISSKMSEDFLQCVRQRQQKDKYSPDNCVGESYKKEPDIYTANYYI